jgi:hypothetical protein
MFQGKKVGLEKGVLTVIGVRSSVLFRKAYSTSIILLQIQHLKKTLLFVLSTRPSSTQDEGNLEMKIVRAQ